MIFSELYGAYYNTVAAILKAAVDHPVTPAECAQLVHEHAFGESFLVIPRCLQTGLWPLMRPDGTTPIQHAPTMPVTLLEKRWLAAICRDPRIRLFGDFDEAFKDVEPLFLPEDYAVFDCYSDGDDYEDPNYIQNFRTILNAVRSRTPLTVAMQNRSGRTMKSNVMPQYLEYSEKDDKFRLIGKGKNRSVVMNLGRIVSCEPCKDRNFTAYEGHEFQKKRKVVFELTDERHALERVLMHFAHFEKFAEQLDENRYRVTITYDKDDETEMVIRLLSFGPKVKVIAPEHFIQCMRERLIQQKSCGQ